MGQLALTSLPSPYFSFVEDEYEHDDEELPKPVWRLLLDCPKHHP